MILISHPTGNANVRALLKAMLRHERQFLFHTTIAFSENNRWLSALPKSIRAECHRRSYPIPKRNLESRPFRELCRLLSSRIEPSILVNHELGWASVDSVYRDLDLHLARRHVPKLAPELQGVYCYEDGALETFRAAKKLGIRCCYDLPIVHWRTAQRLIREEQERRPEWAVTLSGVSDSSAKLERKQEELELADTVICPSRFVYDSLPLHVHSVKRCVIAEFGSPAVQPEDRSERSPSDRPLRVLFAGSLTQRKGLADLFEAVKIASRHCAIELVLLGSPVAPMSFYRAQLPTFTYEPPRSHDQFLELMKTCEVLVLPSLFEGRALVQQEAMSCGLPIIVTPNAGGEDLIEEAKTGFLVPIRSPEILAERIIWCSEHRAELHEMGMAARKMAGEYTWARYGDRVLNTLDDFSRNKEAIESPEIACV